MSERPNNYLLYFIFCYNNFRKNHLILNSFSKEKDKLINTFKNYSKLNFFNEINLGFSSKEISKKSPNQIYRYKDRNK